MPSIDDLLGVATLAAAGMFIAVALQPLPSGGQAQASAGVVVQQTPKT